MSTSSRFILLIAVVLAACAFLVSAAPIVNNDLTELEAGSSLINIKNLKKQDDDEEETTATTSTKSSKKTPTTTPEIKKLKASGSSSSGSYSGDGTFYAPGLGSCGWDNSASDLIVALNHGQMANGANSNKNPNCGKSITVHGPKGSVTVKIVDTCPGCANGDVDLSPAAFNKIANAAQGRVPVTWSWN